MEALEKKRAERLKNMEEEYNNDTLKVKKHQTGVVKIQAILRPANDSIGAQLAFYFPHDRKGFIISPNNGLNAAAGRLPKDLWNFQILLFLDVDDLLNLEHTCKYFCFKLQTS